jgi:hypothetical protein
MPKLAVALQIANVFATQPLTGDGPSFRADRPADL